MTKRVPYKFVTKDALTYLTFNKWEQDEKMIHGFSTRYGGVSQGDLATLNLGFNRGDEEENVVENYRRISKALGVPFKSLVLSKQVHETQIARVNKEDCGNGIQTPNKWESMDGLYTNEKGVTLVTHYADCVPLFFYAPMDFVNWNFCATFMPYKTEYYAYTFSYDSSIVGFVPYDGLGARVRHVLCAFCGWPCMGISKKSC